MGSELYINTNLARSRQIAHIRAQNYTCCLSSIEVTLAFRCSYVVLKGRQIAVDTYSPEGCISTEFSAYKKKFYKNAEEFLPFWHLHPRASASHQ